MLLFYLSLYFNRPWPVSIRVSKWKATSVMRLGNLPIKEKIRLCLSASLKIALMLVNWLIQDPLLKIFTRVTCSRNFLEGRPLSRYQSLFIELARYIWKRSNVIGPCGNNTRSDWSSFLNNNNRTEISYSKSQYDVTRKEVWYVGGGRFYREDLWGRLPYIFAHRAKMLRFHSQGECALREKRAFHIQCGGRIIRLLRV